MERGNTPEEMVIKPADFHSDIEVNLDGTDEQELYDTMVERILENMAAFQSEGSPWRLHSIIRLELHTVRYNSLRGETWIPLPKELAVKKAIINIKNKDNKCFLWCVLRALNPGRNNPERVDKELKSKENTLNMEGIEYPVGLKDLKKFEKQNPTIFITVLGYEGKSFYPLRNSTNTDRDHNIILMLIEEGVKHYCLVKSISRLLASQTTKHNGKQHFCLRCLNPFWCKEALSKHQEYCGEYEAVKIEMPQKGTMLEFKNYHRSEKVPFIVYADFECFIKPILSCDPDDKKSYTKQYQKHEPSSFCYDLHNDYPLAPEQIEVNKVDKLIPNLWNKKKYVIQFENLKQYLSLGLKLTHIHRGIKFEESQWLEKYITLNTELRTAAANEFEKDFFQLMNNSVFGKTMENSRNRVDIKLVNDKKQAEKLGAKPLLSL